MQIPFTTKCSTQRYYTKLLIMVRSDNICNEYHVKPWISWYIGVLHKCPWIMYRVLNQPANSLKNIATTKVNNKTIKWRLITYISWSLFNYWRWVHDLYVMQCQLNYLSLQPCTANVYESSTVELVVRLRQRETEIISFIQSYSKISW